MNHLIIWKETSLFLGSNNTSISEHKHPMIQLIICTNDFFSWKDTNGNWVEKKALLIAPNQTHQCNASGKKVLIIGVDPESIFGQFITNHHLKLAPIIDFPSSFLEKLKIDIINENIKDENWVKLYSNIKLLFGFNTTKFPLKKTDERIKNVLNFISKHTHTKITTETLMNVSYLSESRLLHLFKQEMGLPVRNYILWHRLQLAFKEISKGHSLTEVAYITGFSDQSHLTKTFIKVIGASPSSLLKNSKFIQVSFPV
jgi:AraC-like DNA-binding protein